MRTPQVIVVKHHSIKDRAEIDGCPVWAWSRGEGEQNAVDHASEGDYMVRHEPYTQSGRPRVVAWSVCVVGRLRCHGGLFWGGSLSYHRTADAAVKAATAMLRHDAKHRALLSPAAAASPAD
jgi:hypothetical protein